jgi:hypothetical protein
MLVMVRNPFIFTGLRNVIHRQEETRVKPCNKLMHYFSLFDYQSSSIA